MNKNIFKLIILMGMIFFISGCASFLTFTAPAKSKIIEGEKSIGDFNKYQYRYTVSDNRIAFTKSPLCNEKAMVYRKSQKLPIGYSAAAVEMVFFGLGMIDLANAYAISEYSKKEFPLAEYETGNLMSCGMAEPAANEVVTIKSKQRGINRKALTSSRGTLNLDSILNDVAGYATLSISLDSDPDVRFSYVYKSPELDRKSTSRFGIYQN